MRELIEWHEITERLPDDETTVLVCSEDESYPVWPGWHEDGQWYAASGVSSLGSQALGRDADGRGDAVTLESLKPASVLAEGKPHGTRIRYVGGCHCLKCRMANSNYETARARARAAGDANGIVDATPARHHLVKLARAGVGLRIIEQVTGVARSILSGIKKGSRPRARARTVKKVLAVTTAQRGDASLVTAAHTWKRINTLLDEGYTKTYLAQQMGYARALQLRKDRVTAKNAAKVERLYTRLMT